MMIFVGYFLFLLSFTAGALVPVEGILMGEAQEEIQNDPLKAIFSEIYDISKVGENKKVKLYLSTYLSGQNLHESCSYLRPVSYPNVWSEKQAQRTVVATLQYIGLDTSIKAIGAYAKKMEVSEDNFKVLRKNLITNYCSKNITVFSLRNIEKSLDYYFANPVQELIPTISTSPFVSEIAKNKTETQGARSKEFDLAIKNFRAFCSWGSEVEDYRMLTPYLNNRFIMAFVFKNLLGIQDQIDEKQFKAQSVLSENTVQVTCTDLICRKDELAFFRSKFPQSIGSTGIATDLSKMYCHHFRFQDWPQKTVPEVKQWIKSYELEDPIFETSHFISLMTGVPDFLNASESFVEVPVVARSAIDERWTTWANKVLNRFSKDLLYEESLKVKVEPEQDMSKLSSEGFFVDFSVTLGEMDRLLVDNDKLKLSFELKLSKNFFRSLRTKSEIFEQTVDLEGKKNFHEEVAKYLDLQLREKQKLFTHKMWNEEFSKLIADELIRQARIYRGPMFNTYKDEVFKVPVKFSYGLFALSYLKYRADINSGRIKLNL